ncbi:MAG: tRNA lysidine(34) synthetase TilS [Ginsengibacter sp.]
MPLLKEFIQNIQQQNLFQKDELLLLAVSGGADSVALCELCFQAGFQFEIAHCNFQLRGEESERDERFVRQLGEKYWTKVFVKKFHTKEFAEENRISIQVAARKLRYEWFEELIRGHSNSNSTLMNVVPRFIVTAHHANDNIETLLMNFFKGTGIKGLQGILPKKKKVVRPLLFAKKEEILSFLKENNLEFVEDSSNLSDKYTRNLFRNQLIPSIQKVFPQVEDNLINNIKRFGEIEVLYRQAIELHRENLVEQKGNEILIPVLKLLKAKPLKTIIYEIIKDYGFTAHQAEEVINLLNSESGKYISSSTHNIIKDRNWLIISPQNTLEAENILINKEDKEIEFELGKLVIKEKDSKLFKIPSSNKSVVIDRKEVKFPLLLRKWKQGDYFYPLGMQKKKKLSKFFIDQKKSLVEKERMWVIESDKKILWIVGERIDDRFKITEKTKEVLFIELVGSKNVF